jgi:hypothetical protein
MKKVFVLAMAVGMLAACASTTQLTPAQADEQVKKLMVLYDENKPKFVVQKQELEQADDCGRATALRQAIDRIAQEAAMSPDDTQGITLVQMELQQAEKTCLEK